MTLHTGDHLANRRG